MKTVRDIYSDVKDYEKKAVAVVAGMLPGVIYDEVCRNSNGALQFAADVFQKSLIEGLNALIPDLHVVNVPFISSWPLHYRLPLSPASYKARVVTRSGNEVSLDNRRFTNVTLFKMYTRYRSVMAGMKEFCEQNRDKEQIVVLVYSLHLPFLKAMARLKSQYANLRLVYIVPDLPCYKLDKMSKLEAFMLSYDTHIARHYLEDAGAYVFVTKYMAERLGMEHKPSVVVEGLYTEPVDMPALARDDNGKKRVVYVGSLCHRYNIMNLVNAVHGMERQDIELCICGGGVCEPLISKVARVDNRIKLLGVLPHAEALAMLRTADVLVNPRTPDEAFTRYSFPSTVVEYLASGTPAIFYRLKGIPEEYYKYFHTPANSSPEALARKIEEVIDAPGDDMRNIAEKARRFILCEKNPVAQCLNIVNLINKLK